MNIKTTFFLLFSLSYLSHAAQHPIGIFQHIGSRPYQEDYYDCRNIEDGWWLGVYDGHGGDQISKFLASDSGLAYIFSKTEPSLSIQERMVHAFTQADRHQQSQSDEAGSTAIIVYIKNNNAYFAHVGDSRAILLRASNVLFATSDHKPDRPDEKNRIEENGGTIITRENNVPRVFDPKSRMGLAMSRAIGDQSIKQWIIPTPEYTCHELPEADYLIMGSDGLYDDMSQKTIAEIVYQHKYQTAQELAKILVHEALSKGSTDNTTALVVNLKKLLRNNTDSYETFDISSEEKVIIQKCTCNAKIAIGITFCAVIGTLSLLYQL